MSELLELDDVLESAPPAASTAEVGDILQRRFELSGPVRALSSERDANFRVDTSAGPYLLKITNAAEDPQSQTCRPRHFGIWNVNRHRCPFPAWSPRAVERISRAKCWAAGRTSFV